MRNVGILIDFDDTIFPTTDLSLKYHMSVEQLILLHPRLCEDSQFEKLEMVLERMLFTFMMIGEVVLISNGSFDWIRQTCERFSRAYGNTTLVVKCQSFRRVTCFLASVEITRVNGSAKLLPT